MSIFSNGFQNLNNVRISADPPTHPRNLRLLYFIIITSNRFIHDGNMVYMNLHKLRSFVKKNASFQCKNRFYDQLILKSEHPYGRKPPMHPNLNVVRKKMDAPLVCQILPPFCVHTIPHLFSIFDPIPHQMLYGHATPHFGQARACASLKL